MFYELGATNCDKSVMGLFMENNTISPTKTTHDSAVSEKDVAHGTVRLDAWLLTASVLILVIGLIMVGSASIPLAERSGHGLTLFFRQVAYVCLGLAIAFCVFHVSLENWYRAGPWLLSLSVILLIAVLIPGIGKEVNGAMRWIPLKFTNFQPSEFAKLCMILYLAGYLQRHHHKLANTTLAMILPLFILGFVGILLLSEPDFGSTAILFAVCLSMVFLAGVSLWRFGLIGGLTLTMMSIVLYTSPYRRARLVSFLNPWEDPFNQGFQLIQSLIAIGRGEWFGTGLGGSIQKMGYLPEAHTDFIFAVFAEETGLLGVMLLIILYLTLVYRAFAIGARAERLELKFAAYVAYGIGLWFCFQSFINMAVTMGALPTKGLTLPLMSYGGSSLLVMMSALAILFRIDLDAHLQPDIKPVKKRQRLPTKELLRG